MYNIVVYNYSVKYIKLKKYLLM